MLNLNVINVVDAKNCLLLNTLYTVYTIYTDVFSGCNTVSKNKINFFSSKLNWFFSYPNFFSKHLMHMRRPHI